jgi:bifunctional oligoribonuclease and PAP phosphatase NrnA
MGTHETMHEEKGLTMPLDWAPLVKVINDNKRFLLTTHIRPDSDGLGSLLALGEALEARGKEVKRIVAGSWPARYDFLDPKKTIERFTLPGETWRGPDVVIILDTATWNQLGDFATFLPQLPAVKVVVDHHVSWDELGAARFTDTSAEATGRLVYEIIAALGVPLTPSIANHLFAAVATDTGWFRHSNTTAATFALADKLVAAGAKPTPLYEHLYEQSTLARMRLMGTVLTRLQLADAERVAFTYVQRDDYQTTGANPPDTEDLVNFTRTIAGVEVGIFFMEQPRGGVKVSLRSRDRVDVAAVAKAFGGGGHRQASGAIVDGSLADVQARVLAAVHQALQR